MISEKSESSLASDVVAVEMDKSRPERKKRKMYRADDNPSPGISLLFGFQVT